MFEQKSRNGNVLFSGDSPRGALPRVVAPSLEGLTAEVVISPPPTAENLILRLHEKLRASAPRRERRKGEKPELGDEVECDLVVTKDGRIVPDSLRRSVKLQMRPYPHLPGLVEGILTMSVGSSETLDIYLPSNYPITALAGSSVKIYIKLHRAYDIEVRDPEDSEVLSAAGLGTDLEEAMASVAAEIDAEQGEILLVEATDAVLDAMADRVRARIAEELIDAELEQRWKENIEPLFDSESFSESFLTTAREDFLKDEGLREETFRRIKIGLVLGALIEKEKLAPSPEVMENLLESAARDAGITPEQARKALRDDPESARKAAETALYLTAVEFVMARAKVNVLEPPPSES